MGGAAIYTAANWYLAIQGAKHRKRSGKHQPSEAEDNGSGLAIAVGALLNCVPKSIVIGVSMIAFWREKSAKENSAALRIKNIAPEQPSLNSMSHQELKKR